MQFLCMLRYCPRSGSLPHRLIENYQKETCFLPDQTESLVIGLKY